MSRNTGGNYSLPTGNPVVSGTTISITWANGTLGDLASEMTDSLNRSGKGAMLAPLKVIDGTAAAPALTWDADPDSGIYRAGDGDVRMQINATQAQKWTATGSTIPVPLSVTTAVANTVGLTVSGNGTGNGVTATGGASGGSGLAATGGATSGTGVTGVGGASNGYGGSFTGTGSGRGVDAFGGATSGEGVRGNGGAPNGNGVTGLGAGTGYGVQGVGGTTGPGGFFTPGTAATASARTSGVVVDGGDIAFTTVVNPNSNVAFTNKVTPANVAKVRALLTKASGGGVSITTGFNVASVSVSTTTTTLTFASAFANTNYEVQVTCGGGAPWSFTTNVTSTTTVEIKARNLASGALPLSEIDFSAASGSDVPFYVTIFGAQ